MHVLSYDTNRNQTWELINLAHSSPDLQASKSMPYGHQTLMPSETLWASGLYQGRINHCGSCTMGGGPRHQGAPRSTAKILTTLFWRLNVQCRLKCDDYDWKKVVNFWGEEKCTPRERSARPEKILWLRIWEKGPRITLGWGPLYGWSGPKLYGCQN